MQKTTDGKEDVVRVDFRFHPVCHGLHEVTAGQRIDRIGSPAFLRNDLLSPEGEGDGFLRGKAKCLVV